MATRALLLHQMPMDTPASQHTATFRSLQALRHSLVLDIAGHRGELFAMCPVRGGERMTCVEPAADSSRNFVIRVVDATSGRHAFLGMGFPERDDAFDFNVALSDWDKHAQGGAPSAAGSLPAAAAPQHDFSLKPGESIKVKPVASRASGGGLLSAVAALGTGPSNSGSGGLLAPPLPSAATAATRWTHVTASCGNRQ
jgi:adaptin ear-binding coat-associated protein 1/2